MSGASIFLLSPARLTGARGRRILAGTGRLSTTDAFTDGSRLPLGSVYASISTLYFRGKLAYARRFGAWDEGDPVLVITPDRGLAPADMPVDIGTLRDSATVPIALDEPRYVEPLLQSVSALRERLTSEDRVVLLGSIATPKYVDPLGRTLGTHLFVPRDFVGMGEMRRGSLLLGAVAEGRELSYIPAGSTHRTLGNADGSSRFGGGDGARGGTTGMS